MIKGITMTELEKKAEKYATATYPNGEKKLCLAEKNAYIAGAKENGIIWHSLEENPEDLPPRLVEDGVVFTVSIMVINQNEYSCYYDYDSNTWCTADDEGVIAWTEIPKFSLIKKEFIDE